MSDYAQWLNRMDGQRLLVLGDVILDEYVMGQVTRMSREAPIPVLEMSERKYIPGGAANPAVNLVKLGAHVQQIGIVGVDESQAILIDALKDKGIDTTGLVICDDRPTTLKTRIMAQMGLRFPQQVARVDTLSRAPINEQTYAQLVDKLDEHIENAQAILISDYHGGLLTNDLLAHVKTLSEKHNVLVTVDAQGRFDAYRGFDIIKCNADDAQAYTGKTLSTDDDFADVALQLCKSLAVKQAIVITRGGDGATIALTDGTIAHIPAPHVSDVFDTVGAGDTAIAVMTLAILAGATVMDAVYLANVASGIVVTQVGNYAPSREEIRAQLGE